MQDSEKLLNKERDCCEIERKVSFMYKSFKLSFKVFIRIEQPFMVETGKGQLLLYSCYPAILTQI